ncbi:hypothetical protein L1987_08158 [Smallanthus sonchifolius]|uniref:Uncharacterized protein n=1 Tax=Smallanthus sonchifolius TaxID=185202 RepID=A0ACB9JM47_9ASTR|nr:hypothetical protein L1987_08158 [Smallanthus sonchifolius]
MKMKTRLLLLFCIQLLAISFHHHLILSKGLTIQQLEGVEGVEVDSGNTVLVKHEIKAGKGPYGSANINRDPRPSKSNATSSHFPRGFCISIGISISVGFFVPLLFGF